MNPKPNILFLLSDEHSFRHMSYVSADEGGEPVSTPAFDVLARQATVFTNAYCQMPLCTPSRISLLTGKNAQKSGAWNNESVLRPELDTIPKALVRAGYETCLVGKMHLGGNQQLAGFRHRPYGDLTGKTGHQWEPIESPAKGMRERTSTAVGITGIPESQLQENIVCRESLAWLREHAAKDPAKPWMLCASFSRPHFPLTAPRRYWERWIGKTPPPRIGATGDAQNQPMTDGMRKGFQTKAINHDEMMTARAGYFACVEFLDEIIGDFLTTLEAAGLLENTIIIYTSDHGELAGEHGLWWKNGWFEACTRVPLIISTPEHRRKQLSPSRCDAPVGLYDLFPTLTSIAGADTPADLDGVDISPALRGEDIPSDRPVFCDSLIPRWGEGTEFRSIRWKSFKYVRFRACEPLMFDLAADLGEQVNLLKKELSGEAAAAKGYLERLANESIDFDSAERDRTERDGRLHEIYRQPVRSMQAGNYYMLASGRIVHADTILYRPEVLAEKPEAIFGDLPVQK